MIFFFERAVSKKYHKILFFMPLLMKLKLNVSDIRQVEIISFFLERDTICSVDLFSVDQCREKERVQW